MAEILLVTSGKGGVGKSTVSLLTGAALAQRGKKVLLIEMDAGLGGLDIMLGVEDQTVFDLADVLKGRCEPIKAIMECPYQRGLSLLGAPRDTSCNLERKSLTFLCKGLTHYYDYIFIDAPAGLSCGFTVGAEICNRALVVVTPDPVAVRDGRVMSDLLDRSGITRQRLVINKVGKKFLGQKLFADLDEVIDAAGVQLIGVIPEDRELTACIGKGQPIDEAGRTGKVFAALAGRLMGEEIPLIVR
ncbi:nucleotide-binding protein [Zongyangia hominis]|uniref:P-loop NTPase n=1 Tax=Zongyangia hominis TaxID=2763677 RepID=A0A926ECL1_9FIRM|nr:P-loop NTPase [Zongyangia hominis]MBC8571348.1 P-loop NTPase [Zongyangia hominis]